MIETHPEFLAVKQRLEEHFLKGTMAIEDTWPSGCPPRLLQASPLGNLITPITIAP